MCTRPITITKTYPSIGTKSYTVPCGKCAECVSKKRSQLAALSVHQGFVSGDVRFFTLTYRNSTCPVAIYDPALEKVVGFERGVDDWMKGDVFTNELHIVDGLAYTPSLCREDLKLVFKQFRMTWKRLHGETPKFKYCFFGEYGDRSGRPHMHGLVYGMSAEQIDLLKNLWTSRFGFVAVLPELSRPVTMDDIEGISFYVSKYISKGVNQRFADLLPFVEKPRRQSSLDFGEFSDRELVEYARFLMAAILDSQLSPDDYLDSLPLMTYLFSLIAARISRFAELFSLFPIL